ncbi:unnamed protein product, partial [Owenia fusiformis]
IKMSESGRKIWVQVKRYDLAVHDEDMEPPTSLSYIETNNDMEPQYIHQLLRQRFRIRDDSLVLKLRNNRGSLVPINSSLLPTQKSVPYILEVVKVYQNNKPQPRNVQRTNYNETLKKKLDSFDDRIEKMEAICPELRIRRDAKLKREMEELDRKLVFLNKRFQQAEPVNWEGMFRKNPMW